MVCPTKDKSTVCVTSLHTAGSGLKQKWIYGFPRNSKEMRPKDLRLIWTRLADSIFGTVNRYAPGTFMEGPQINIGGCEYLCMGFRVTEDGFIVHGQVTPLCSNEIIPRVKIIILFLSYFFLSHQRYINFGDLWPAPSTLNEQDFNRRRKYQGVVLKCSLLCLIRQNHSKCTNQNYFWKSFQVRQFNTFL